MAEAREALKGKPFMAAYEEDYLEKVKEKAARRITDIFNEHKVSMICDFDSEEDLHLKLSSNFAFFQLQLQYDLTDGPSIIEVPIV